MKHSMKDLAGFTVLSTNAHISFNCMLGDYNRCEVNAIEVLRPSR